MSEDPDVRPEPNYGPVPNGTPPQWPYGAPPLINGTNEPSARPLPLDAAIRQLPDQYIKVLTKPGARVFALEQGKAAWNIIWAQIVILMVINVLGGLVTFGTSLPESLASSHVSNQIIQVLKTFSGAFALSYIILTPLFFFIGVGIYYLIGKAFGGRGTFLAYSYSYLLFGVPLNLISTILVVASGMLGLTSFVGSLAAVAVSIYQIVLQVFMTMGVHRLSGGKATLAVLLLPIILFVLTFGLIVVSIVLFLATHHAP